MEKSKSYYDWETPQEKEKKVNSLGISSFLARKGKFSV